MTSSLLIEHSWDPEICRMNLVDTVIEQRSDYIIYSPIRKILKVKGNAINVYAEKRGIKWDCPEMGCMIMEA